MRDEGMKNENMRDEGMKNENIRDEGMKNENIRDEGMNNENMTEERMKDNQDNPVCNSTTTKLKVFMRLGHYKVKIGKVKMLPNFIPQIVIYFCENYLTISVFGKKNR